MTWKVKRNMTIYASKIIDKILHVLILIIALTPFVIIILGIQDMAAPEYILKIICQTAFLVFAFFAYRYRDKKNIIENEMEDNMIDSEFFGTVKDMRAAQKEYFRTKSYESLVKAKELEKAVDGMIKETERKTPKESQLDLFGGNGNE